MQNYDPAIPRRGWGTKSTMYLKWKRFYLKCQKKALTSQWHPLVIGPKKRELEAAKFFDTMRGTQSMDEFYTEIQKQGQGTGIIKKRKSHKSGLI